MTSTLSLRVAAAVAGFTVALLIAVAILEQSGRRAEAAPGEIAGRLPIAGKFGLIVWGGGTMEELVAEAAVQGCALSGVRANGLGDDLVLHIVGAPSVVNEDFARTFPATIPPNTPLLIQCSTRFTPRPRSGTVMPTPQSPTPPPSPPAPAIPNVAGNWSGSLGARVSATATPRNYDWTLTFTQSGSSVRGTMSYSSFDVMLTRSGSVALSGTIDANGDLELSGTEGSRCFHQYNAHYERGQLSGTFTWTGCQGNPSHRGEWSGTKR